MKLAVLCVLVTCTSLVKGANKGVKILRKTPLPAPNFDIELFLGTWYDLVFHQPCSYKGAEDHSNQRHHYTLRKGYVAGSHSYRGPEGDCVINIPTRLYFTNRRGEARISDNVGRAMNGIIIFVVLNPKKYVVEWGCSGKIENGLCTDPWFAVKTRHPHPDPYTIEEIFKLIYQIFGVTANELRIRDQSNPCYGGKGYAHARKGYAPVPY